MCPKRSLERWRLQGVACLYKTERPESLCYCASHQPLANTANRLPTKYHPALAAVEEDGR